MKKIAKDKIILVKHHVDPSRTCLDDKSSQESPYRMFLRPVFLKSDMY